MKKALATLLAVMMLVSLFACGENANPDNSAEDSAPFQAESTAPVESETVTANNEEQQGTIGTLEEIIEKDIENSVGALNAELGKVVADIDTYDEFVKNISTIEAFYEKVNSDTESLCIRMREYSVNYAELIMASTSDDKYDDLEDLYDIIYDDACDDIYDGIYDDFFDDVYDAFYDGVLDDRPDEVPYSDWSDIHSDEYKRWADAHSDVYKTWSDTRSDIYGFYSDLRGELWSDDIERAEKKITDFQEDIEKLKNKIKASDEKEPEHQEIDQGAFETTGNAVSVAPSANGIRPEFKQAMDSYEAFFDEYIAFMESFSSSDNTLAMLADYTGFMSQYAETMEAMDGIDQNELSTEELSYYLEVTTRINQKLLSIAY